VRTASVRRFLLPVVTLLLALIAPRLRPSAAQTLAPILVLGPLVQMDATGGLRIVWWTDRPGRAEVQLGVDGATTVAAESWERWAEAPSPLDHFWQHVAPLPSLPAGTAVPYRLLMDGQALPAGPFTLRVPPDRPPLRLAIVGDYGSGLPAEQAVRDLIAAQQPDLILTTGDNAYPRGRYEEFHRYVFAVYGDLMAQVPFMPAIGNHDDITGHATPYRELFVLPENGWRPEERERYYSFDVANAHVVVLDSTDGLAAISDAAEDDMADWLAADLAATDKPWRIILFHHPPYSAGVHGSHSLARQRLTPVLEAGGVQWVFNGHEHDYQRTCPIRQERCVEPGAGITYVITGGGGAGLRPTGQDWFTRRALSVHHAAFLTLDDCLARLTVRDQEGQVVDQNVVLRCPLDYRFYLPWVSQAAVQIREVQQQVRDCLLSLFS